MEVDSAKPPGHQLRFALDEAIEPSDWMALKAQVEERVVSLETFAAKQFTSRIVAEAEAYRDQDGRAHSKFFLEWLEAFLACEEFDEGAIKLEDGTDVGDVHAYYRKMAYKLAVSMPGVVPMTPPQTEREDDRI